MLFVFDSIRFCSVLFIHHVCGFFLSCSVVQTFISVLKSFSLLAYDKILESILWPKQTVATDSLSNSKWISKLNYVSMRNISLYLNLIRPHICADKFKLLWFKMEIRTKFQIFFQKLMLVSFIISIRIGQPLNESSEFA